jgi:hypothetical protein
MKHLVALLFAFLFSPAVNALQIAERFTDRTHFDANNSTALWNHTLHYVTPLIWLDRTTGGAEAYNAADQVNIGDGRHGIFNTTTFASFSVGGSTPSNVITINTDVFSDLQFTTFDLPSGWILRGSGTRPLIIRIMGNATIAGSIDCSGSAGGAGGGSVSVVPSGGVGRCGGAAGGNGSVTTGVSGGNGTSSTVIANSRGVGGGNNVGGGGGSGNSSSTGSNGAGGGGAAGSNGLDSYLDTFTYGTTSGGGGGGGGGFNTGSSVPGGGGGAGGGIVRFFVGGDVTLTGSILATGGNGGSGVGNTTGGGGAGGIVTLFTPGSIFGGGTIDAQGGNGGNNDVVNGVGGPGNTWIAFGGGTGAFANNPNFDGPDPGEVLYRSNTSYILQSLPQDTRNTSPTYTAFVKEDFIPNTSTITFQIAGSNDGFVNDDTGWVNSTSVSTLQGKRWYRYKITFNYIPAAAQTAPIPVPLKITAVAAQYAGHQQTDFNFTPACGNFGGAGEFIFILLSCYFGGLLTTGRLRKGILSRRPKKISLESRQL